MLMVRFIDNEGDIQYGILTDEDRVICACCGGVYERDEIEILNVFEWIYFREVIGENYMWVNQVELR